ncbi:MAG: hypothetical protein K6L80_03070 [Agarilytica sp.]
MIDSQAGDPYQTVRESALRELSRRGYREGAGFTYEYHSLSHYGGAAKNLWNHRIKKNDYDVIFLTGTLACKSFKDIAWQSDKHKFIYAAVTDPVGLGLIGDYGETPTGNFTGVAFHVPVEVRMNFVRELIPNLKHIGIVHADMPQAHSYRMWLENVLKQEEWKGVTLHYRQVDFIPSEGGHKRMAQMAARYIKELDPIVDVFLSPSDQMGAQSPFAKMASRIASKPLIGIGKQDVVDGWGATASIYPDEKALGEQAAVMVERVIQGERLTDILPERAKRFGIVIDKAKADKFNVTISDALEKKATLINE